MRVFSVGSELVQEFHETYGQAVRTEPVLDIPEREMRWGLIDEEHTELVVAQNNDDFIEVVDAWADIVYVTYGAGKAHGVDIDAIIAGLDLPDPAIDDGRRVLSSVPNLYMDSRWENMETITRFHDSLGRADMQNNFYAMQLRWALLIYSVYDAAYQHGVDLNMVLLEVQRSNMSKLETDENGNKFVLRREDGKILKGSHFSQPDILGCLVEQGYVAP